VVELGGAAADPLDIELGLGLGEPNFRRFGPKRGKLEGNSSDTGQHFIRWGSHNTWQSLGNHTPKNISPFLILLKEWTVEKTGSPAHFRKEYGERKKTKPVYRETKKITFDHVGVTRFSGG